MRQSRRALQRFADQMMVERNEMANDLNHAKTAIIVAKSELRILENSGVILPRLTRALNGERP